MENHKNGRAAAAVKPTDEAPKEPEAPEVTPDMLAAVDLDFLPPAFEDEVIAVEIVDLTASWRKTWAALKAARAVGNSQEIDTFSKVEARLRNQVAFLQNKYPNAKAIATEIAAGRAKRAQENRALQ